MSVCVCVCVCVSAVFVVCVCVCGVCVVLECCLLYISDGGDEEESVDLGGRGSIKKKTRK